MGRQVAPGVWEFQGPGGVAVQGKGASEQDAKLDAVMSFNRQSQAATQAGPKAKTPDFVGRIKAALVGDLSPAQRGASMQGDIREPSATAAALKGVGDVVLPGSLEELAVQAATLGGGAAGRMAGKAVGGGALGQVAQTATGLALPTAAGAAVTTAKGEGPGRGAALGAMAGGMAEGARIAFQGTGAAVEKLTRKWGGLEQKYFDNRVREVVGPMMARDIAADIPSLREARITLRSAPDVIKLLDDSTGRQVVGKMFDRVEGEVAKKVGTIELPRDVLVAAGRQDLLQAASGRDSDMANQIAKTLGRPVDDPAVAATLKGMGINPGEAASVPVSGRDAIDIAKQLRHQGLRRGEGIAGRPPRVMADDVQQRLDTALADDKLKATYTQLRDDYSKFMDLRDWLTKADPSKLFPGLVTKGGATLDLVHIGNSLMKDIADVPPSRFPNLHRTFTGEGTGTRAVEGTTSSLLPHAGLGVPGTHARVYLGTPKAPLPETPANLAVGTMPPGGISRAGKVAAGVGRAGAAAAVPALAENQ